MYDDSFAICITEVQQVDDFNPIESPITINHRNHGTATIRAYKSDKIVSS